MRPRLKLLCSLFLGLLLFSVMAGSAQAAFKIDYVSNTPFGGGQTQYNYNIVFSTLTGQESVISDAGNLSPGTTGSQDYVTIYDVSGFVSTAFDPTLFTFQTQSVGVNGPGTSPLTGDDPALLNITYRYTGSLPLTTDSSFAVSIISMSTGTVGGSYTSQQTNVAENATKIGETGRVLVPGPQVIVPVVPEPASMAIWCLGALGCAVGGYLRRSK